MDYEAQLSRFKVRSVNHVFNWLLALICFAVPLSLSRWFVTGYLPVYTVHISVILFALGIFYFRKSLPNVVTEVFLICCCFTVGIGSTSTFGFSANTVSMFMLLVLLLSITRRKAFVFGLSGLYIFILAGMGYLYSIGYLQSEVNLQEMRNEPVTWISNIGIMAIAGGSAINALLNLFTLKNKLLDKISQQKQEIEYLANHDNLTGLPTLRVSGERLNSAIKMAEQHKNKTFILFLDLDGFKQVNDTLGHDVGDKVLKIAANKMLSIIRETDTCCRIGGDEFLIIMSNVRDTAAVERVCESLISEMSLPISIEGQIINIGVSIGGASYPVDGMQSIELKKCADERMYEVKKAGKNNYLLESE